MEFEKFNKIPRLSRECVITEKIDGTNGQIYIEEFRGGNSDIFPPGWTDRATGWAEDQEHMNRKETIVVSFEKKPFLMLIGSRTRWLSHHEDNYGFWNWCNANKEELVKLGEGRHFGEWWGHGIQRGYGLKEKRFSLFNVHKWNASETRPECCHVAPVLKEGLFDTQLIESALSQLVLTGSRAAPDFKGEPEGIVIYHRAGGYLFKKTVEKDDVEKFFSSNVEMIDGLE